VYGQLGVGDTAVIRDTPVEVSAVSDVSELEVGEQHGCIIDSVRKLWCWGANWQGQLGLDDQVNRDVPTELSSISNVAALALGRTHSCAVDGNGKVWCWGSNTKGQLGLGDTQDRYTPTELSTLSDIALLAGRDHNCAVDNTQEVFCWGDNSNFQLSLARTIASSNLPTKVIPAQYGVTQLALGQFHSCALVGSGTVWCWGDNREGQLGLGPNSPLKVRNPTMITGL